MFGYASASQRQLPHDCFSRKPKTARHCQPMQGPPPPMNNTSQSGVTTAPQPANHISPQDAHVFKCQLNLPRSVEEWEEADNLLYAVTHSVLQAITAEEKTSCLCTGVYELLSQRFGTRALPRPRKQMQLRLRQHDRALKKVTQLKNDARRALRRAKKQGESAPIVQSLAANFLYLLRTHSRLKRDSSHRLQHMEAKIARNECNQDFWRYAKGFWMEIPPPRQFQISLRALLFPSSLRSMSQLPINLNIHHGCRSPLHPSQAVLWR